MTSTGSSGWIPVTYIIHDNQRFCGHHGPTAKYDPSTKWQSADENVPMAKTWSTGKMRFRRQRRPRGKNAARGQCGGPGATAAARHKRGPAVAKFMGQGRPIGKNGVLWQKRVFAATTGPRQIRRRPARAVSRHLRGKASITGLTG